MGKTQQIGQAAEDLACDYLLQQGLNLITRNFRCRMGEIDLIMRDSDNLVFVEVRCRKNNDFGGSLHSVTRAKQTKLTHTASFYLQQQKLTEKVAVRFDVIGITFQTGKPQVEWVKNAICY